MRPLTSLLSLDLMDIHSEPSRTLSTGSSKKKEGRKRASRRERRKKK